MASQLLVRVISSATLVYDIKYSATMFLCHTKKPKEMQLYAHTNRDKTFIKLTGVRARDDWRLMHDTFHRGNQKWPNA